MEVALQVVGIFYSANVTVPDANPTVESLMDAAQHPSNYPDNVTNFAYTPHSVGRDKSGAMNPATMFKLSATYAKEFTSRVLENKYRPGVYSMSESFAVPNTSNPYSVWQYYMFDTDGAPVKTADVSEPFSTQPLVNAGVDKNQTVARVVWRLVSILSGPSTALADYGEDLVAARPHPKMATRG